MHKSSFQHANWGSKIGRHETWACSSRISSISTVKTGTFPLQGMTSRVRRAFPVRSAQAYESRIQRGYGERPQSWFSSEMSRREVPETCKLVHHRSRFVTHLVWQVSDINLMTFLVEFCPLHLNVINSLAHRFTAPRALLLCFYSSKHSRSAKGDVLWRSSLVWVKIAEGDQQGVVCKSSLFVDKKDKATDR